MCSVQQAIPFVALAVFSASDWEAMLRDRVKSWMDGGSKDSDK